MYGRKKQNKKYLIFIIFGIVVILFFGSYLIVRKKKTLNPVEAVIKDGGLFFEKILLYPFRIFKDIITDDELQKLKEQASASESLKAQNQELEHQLLELKKSLNLNTVLSDRVYLNATAINRNLDYWYRTLTLDKGSHHGVKEKMPVIVNEGLIGVTESVSNFNSTVKLLTSDTTFHRISVKIEVGDHYVYGLLTGYNRKNSMFSVEGISENTEIPIGSLVTTTGLGEDMPAGIIVGYVKNITTDNFDLAKLVEIESKVNFDDINYVTILKRKDIES